MITNTWAYFFLIFIFGFLNLVPLLRRHRLLFICAVNALVYSLLASELLPALLLFSSFTYLCALLIRDGKFKSTAAFAVLIFLLTTLTLFIMGKIWLNFPLARGVSLKFLIPLGFSYICLQNIAFVVDTWNRKHEDFPNLLEFFASSTFFANISSGPIADLYQVKRDIVRNQVSLADVKVGTLRIVNGFFKKSLSDLISLSLLFPGDSAFVTNPRLYFIPGLLLKFYFDFSGYVDMAVGAARILGVQLPENFNRPYAAVTMADYWNRWHMTLGGWFKNYFFYPLQLFIFRRSRLRESLQIVLVTLSLFITFVLIGLWHGINLKFFCWGLFNAFLVILSNKIIRLRYWTGERLGRWIFCGLTLFFVFIGQLLLLSENFESFVENSLLLFSPERMDFVVLVMALLLSIILFMQHAWDAQDFSKDRKRLYAVMAAQIVLSVLLHQDGGAFLYAGF